MMIRSIFLRGLLFAVLWWILAEGRDDGWLFGGMAVAAAIWTSLKLLPPARQSIHLAGLMAFLRFFVWHSLRGGMQVAGMAMRGRAALQPAIIELQVSLPPGSPRILLVNALGLMPGTLGVDLDGTHLRLHVLDDCQPIVAETRALEALITDLFEDVS